MPEPEAVSSKNNTEHNNNKSGSLASPVTPNHPPTSSSTDAYEQQLEPDFIPLATDYEPSPLDVVCGRGRGYYSCPGNVMFRDIVQRNVPYYLAQPTKSRKTAVLKDIVHQTKANGKTKFVKQMDGNHWHELSFAMAHDKVGNAMREAVTAYRRQERNKKENSNNSKSEGGEGGPVATGTSNPNNLPSAPTIHSMTTEPNHNKNEARSHHKQQASFQPEAPHHHSGARQSMFLQQQQQQEHQPLATLSDGTFREDMDAMMLDWSSALSLRRNSHHQNDNQDNNDTMMMATTNHYHHHHHHHDQTPHVPPPPSHHGHEQQQREWSTSSSMSAATHNSNNRVFGRRIELLTSQENLHYDRLSLMSMSMNSAILGDMPMLGGDISLDSSVTNLEEL